MGKRLLSIVLAAVMLLGMCGTTWAAETTGTNAVTQAGNTMGTATQIYFDRTYNGSITSSNTADWYKITLPSSGRITIAATGYMRYIAYKLYQNSNQVLWSKNATWRSETNTSQVNEEIDLTSGTYYFYVGDWGSTGNYSFRLSFASAGESFKETGSGSNNLLTTANGISLGTTYKGQLAENDKKDFYIFTLPSSGRLKIDATSYMRFICYKLYDSEQDNIWSKNVTWKTETNTGIVNLTLDLTAGTYYFYVGDWGSTGNYSFNLSFTSAGESFAESGTGTNNLLQNANAISLGKRYYGQVALNDEKDFYRFSVSNACELTLSATAYMKYIYYKIYDADGQQLWSRNPYWNSDKACSDITESIQLKQGGTYYLYVGRDGSYTGNYNFALSSSLSTPTVTLRTDSSTGKPIISWNRVPGATQYEIYRSASSNSGYQIIRRTSGLSYTDTTAQAGSYYYYKVRAMDDAGVRGSFSSAKSIRCLSAARLGTPTVTVGASATTGKPVISWSRVSGAAQYEVYRSTSGADGTYGRLCTTANLSYTDTSAATGRTYYYRVRAINGSQTGSFSSAKSIRVSAASALAAPSMTLSTDSSTGKPVIRWSKVSGATQYEIFKSETGAAGSYYRIRRTSSTAAYVDSAAQTGKTYYYVVRAMRGTVTNPTYSRFCAAKAVKCTLPAPDISIGFSGGKPVISWNKVPGAAQYEVYRSTSGAAGTYKIVRRTTTLSYTDTSAASGTYVYRVRCINSSTGLYSGFSPALSVVR